MRTHTVELPSDLVVTLREFKVSDENLLANPKSIRKGTATNDLLNAITVELVDPGPYDFSNSANRVNWAKVLQGDRMVTLKENRVLTWGPEVPASQTCPRCRTPKTHSLDLNEFPVKKLPESSKDHVSTGTPLAVTLPISGKVVRFKLLRGEDDKGLSKIQKARENELASALMRFRIVEVEGVSQADLTPWIEDMSGADSSFLRAAFEEADCGLEQEVEWTCDTCDYVWLDDVRLDKDFLFPKYRGRTTATP